MKLANSFASLFPPQYEEGKCDEYFEKLFSSEQLYETFEAEFSNKEVKGVDRLNAFQFAKIAREALGVVSEKCLNGKFRFSPYLEVLKTKGREKQPRLIGVPTIRDRIVLYQLNRLLAAIYPDLVPRSLASSYVRNISGDIQARSVADTWICSTDILTFYDSIDRTRLLLVLKKKVNSRRALALISHALDTPIVPKNSGRRKRASFSTKIGVPQGLAISNILAAVYMQDVDLAMVNMDIRYFRYVDDVLIYGGQDAVNAAFLSLQRRLSRRGLRLHSIGSGKTTIQSLSVKFGYLGYVFEWPKISVRESTQERFLQSIAAKFSDYIHNKSRRLESRKYLNEARLKEIFLLELNERITGAISKNRRYGWIAYFNQITDLSLLHRLDFSIRKMFDRVPDFEKHEPGELKKLSRAYFEMKFNPRGGYVRDYDKISTEAEMLSFLVERGWVAPDEEISADQIQVKFLRYVGRSLAAMHADEGVLYN